MTRLIIFLIRRKLKLKKWQWFQFDNQRDKTVWYYFEPKHLIKVYTKKIRLEYSGVSLNWLLNKDCKIRRKR